MKKLLLILLIFVTVIAEGQQKKYSIGNMTIIDSSNSIALWNNRDLATELFLIDTLQLNSQKLLLKNLALIPDSTKYVSKRFAGDLHPATYSTIQGAINGSGAGTMILVFPDTYDEAIKLKDQVSLYLYEGVKIAYSSDQDTLSTIRDSLAVNCAILGSGVIERGYIYVGNFPPITTTFISTVKLYNANSNVYIEAKTLSNLNDDDLTSLSCYPSITYVFNGNLTVNAKNLIYAGIDQTSSSVFSIYSQGGSTFVTADSLYNTAAGGSVIYAYNSKQVVTIRKNVNRVSLLSSKNANAKYNLASITSNSIIDSAAIQEINADNITYITTATGVFINARFGATQKLNIKNSITAYSNQIGASFSATVTINAKNIKQLNPVVNPSQPFFLLSQAKISLNVTDTISSYRTTLYFIGNHYPENSPSYSNYDTSYLNIKAGYISCENDSGHAILNDFGRVNIQANKIISGGYATIVSNGGELKMNVLDSIRSRKNVPTARASGDSCVAVWLTNKCRAVIQAGVIRADSTCYAIITQDSVSGIITANEISTKHGSAIKHGSARTVTIKNANIQSDSLNSAGYYVGTILVNSNSLVLQNCIINTLKQTSGVYSIYNIGGGTSYDIIGVLQANKTSNLCNSKGVYVLEGEIQSGICGADKETSFSTTGFAQFGDLATPEKRVLINLPITVIGSGINTVAHGITDYRKIVSVDVKIVDDSTGWYLPLGFNASAGMSTGFLGMVRQNLCYYFVSGTAVNLLNDTAKFLITYTQ